MITTRYGADMKSLAPLAMPNLWPSYRRSLSAAGRTPATLRGYRQSLEGWTAWCVKHGYPTEPEDQTREHVENWMVHLRTVSTSSTVATRYRHLHAWFNWLVAEDEIEKSPMGRMKMPTVDEKPPAVFTDIELRAMLKATEGKGFQQRRDHAILRIMIDDGLRRGELAAMTLDDIDLDTNTASIRKSKTHKGRAPVFSAKTSDAIDRYLRERRKHRKADSNRLWLGLHGPLTGDGIRQVLGGVAKRAGVQGSFPHRFRHTMAHRAKVAGMSDGDLMQIGGWANAQSLRGYGSSEAAARANVAHRRLLDAHAL